MSGSERVKRPTIIQRSWFVRHKDFAEPSCDKSCAGIDRDDLAGGPSPNFARSALGVTMRRRIAFIAQANS